MSRSGQRRPSRSQHRQARGTSRSREMLPVGSEKIQCLDGGPEFSKTRSAGFAGTSTCSSMPGHATRVHFHLRASRAHERQNSMLSRPGARTGNQANKHRHCQPPNHQPTHPPDHPTNPPTTNQPDNQPTRPSTHPSNPPTSNPATEPPNHPATQANQRSKARNNKSNQSFKEHTEQNAAERSNPCHIQSWCRLIYIYICIRTVSVSILPGLFIWFPVISGRHRLQFPPAFAEKREMEERRPMHIALSS